MRVDLETMCGIYKEIYFDCQKDRKPFAPFLSGMDCSRKQRAS